MEKYGKPALEVINLEGEQSILYASGSPSTYSLWVDDDGYADDDDW